MIPVRILLPPHLRHPGEIRALYASKDPRLNSFSEEEVVIDARACEFIRPAAVLWCVVYPLLAKLRGARCEFLVPDDMGVCVYLKSLGLFSLLSKHGVEVDERNIWGRQDRQLLLPLASFQTQTGAEELTNAAYEALLQAGLGAANLYPVVTEVFAELALNAVEHSTSPIGAFGFIQFYRFKQSQRFVCGVADGGIGIRRSLERNPQVKERVPYDWVAIELAIRERISGTGQPTRGIGLFGVAEDMRQPGRQLILHSGIGVLTISEQLESRARRINRFPGTMAYASIPS